MPTDIATTAAEEFPLAVNAPAGGDPRTAASVRVMGQALADQSLWNWRRLQTLLGSFCPLGGYGPVAITGVSVLDDEITLPGHGFSNNDPVRVVPATDGGVPPVGLAANTVYYAIVVDASTLQLSATSGPGAAVDITGALSGDVYLARVDDPAILLPTVGSVTAGKLSAILARYAKVDPFTMTVDTDAFDILGTSAKGGLPANVAVGEIIGFALRVPHGNVLQSVTVYISPATDGILPATKPVVSVIRRDLTDGSASTLGSQVDTAANAAAYEVYHGITVSSLASTIDRSRYMYSVRFDGEASTNAQAVLVVGATYTVT